jgi:hypothetical protein
MGTTSLNQATESDLIQTLRKRFIDNGKRHALVRWEDVEKALLANKGMIKAIMAMEGTGGEPDVIGSEGGRIIFCDCSRESPAGRRSYCYDRQALDGRKSAKPENNVIDAAAEMGIELLDEEGYRRLQSLGDFDTKTQSWILTPRDVRDKGGALFGDRRYGRVFIYHNGADSFFGSRGFRGLVRL